MKFVYQYRTSDNVQHRGEIVAASREAAFVALKARGIRPGWMDEAPGFFNKLFGKGKRWLAIGVLSLVSVGLIWTLYQIRVATDRKENGALDRRQLLGDASVIARGSETDWAGVFTRSSDRFLARYVQPGVPVRLPNSEELEDVLEELGSTMSDSILPEPADLDEMKQVKRIVAGIRQELAEFVRDGGTVKQYVDRLVQRQQYETVLRNRAKKGLADVRQSQSHEAYIEEWKRVNLELRKFGLALIPLVEGE